MNLTRQEIPDCQVKDAADQYMNALILLNKMPPMSGVLLPLINTAAIAIELYLKSLSSEVIHTPQENMENMYIVTAKPQQFGHGLVSILKKIPEDYVAEINQIYASLHNHDSRNFKAVLDSLEGAFMQSRYPFEKGADISKYSLKDIKNVSQFLSDYVNGLEVKETIYGC